jgi:hypothetical protein
MHIEITYMYLFGLCNTIDVNNYAALLNFRHKIGSADQNHCGLDIANGIRLHKLQEKEGRYGIFGSGSKRKHATQSIYPDAGN